MFGTALLLFACQTPSDEINNLPEEIECENTSRSEINDTDIFSTAQSDTLFALDLKSELVTENENIFLSPFSITSALGLLHLGAGSISDTEMQDALYMTDPLSWHQGKGVLTQELHQPFRCDYQMSIANRIFAQSGYEIESEYLEEVDSIYGAPLEELDFIANPTAARDYINKWVSDETLGHIPELLPETSINHDTKVVLTNAIYMNSEWKSAFDPRDTRPMPFITEAGNQVEVDMMFQSEMSASLYMDETLTAATFPYQGDELSMTVYLPNEEIKLSELEESLTAEKIEDIRLNGAKREVSTYMPKFEIRSKINLNQPLIKLGMSSLFDPFEADLSGISTQSQLFVSVVIHEAWVKVDETGTEAAAATAVVNSDTSETIPEFITIDRAFMFTIEDNLSGSILFMGRVADPTSE